MSSIFQQKLWEPLPYEKDSSFLNLCFCIRSGRVLMKLNLEQSLSHPSEPDYSSHIVQS